MKKMQNIRTKSAFTFFFFFFLRPFTFKNCLDSQVCKIGKLHHIFNIKKLFSFHFIILMSCNIL